MKATAERVALSTLIVIAIVALALALWKLKLVLALIFLAFILAAALRPGIDRLGRAGVPRGLGLAIHYLAIAGLLTVALWFVVPPAVEVTLKVFEVVLGLFFVLASAAYWIFERDRAVDFVTSLLPRPRRKKVRDTWDLIDLKLGAFVRGQALLIVLVGTVLSVAFWAIGLPYFILIGAFAGLVEIVPVIGPIAAGTLAVAVGATESWHMALAAGICVLGVRLLEDYLIVPKVLGEAVGLSPLLVLVSVTAVGILFGGFAVILAVPLVAVLVTLLDVVVRDVDPAEEDVPTVLFPAKDAEA